MAGAPTIAELLESELRGWQRYAAASPPSDLNGWPGATSTAGRVGSGWAEATVGDTCSMPTCGRTTRVLTPAGAGRGGLGRPLPRRRLGDLVALLASAMAVGLDPQKILALHPVIAAPTQS